MNAKILIADDESDIVSMLGNFFESKGFRVLPAFNGAEALKQVEKQPDIILLDINMPGTDGLEVCKRIRDHISCPILFLTARIEDTDKVKGFAVGGDDYIVKPFLWRKELCYGIKNSWTDKKVRFQNRRGQFEYYLNKWRLRLTGCKWCRENNAYAAALQYPKSYFRENSA